MTPPKFKPCWILWKFVGHDSTHTCTIFISTCINHLLSWFVQIDFILNSHLWVHLSSILKFSFLFSILELNNTFEIKATLQHWKHLYKQPPFANHLPFGCVLKWNCYCTLFQYPFATWQKKSRCLSFGSKYKAQQ